MRQAHLKTKINLIFFLLIFSVISLSENRIFTLESIGNQENAEVGIRRERRRAPYHANGSPDGRRRYHHGGFHRNGYHHGGHNHGDRIWNNYNNQYWGQRIYDYNWSNFDLGGDGFGYGYWRGAGPWVSNTGEFPGYVYFRGYYYPATVAVPIVPEKNAETLEYYYDTQSGYEYESPQ